jgi:hypothetical protein
MSLSFGDLTNEIGLTQLNQHLATRSYIDGSVIIAIATHSLTGWHILFHGRRCNCTDM